MCGPYFLICHLIVCMAPVFQSINYLYDWDFQFVIYLYIARGNSVYMVAYRGDWNRAKGRGCLK
jgi:hypothetical protein